MDYQAFDLLGDPVDPNRGGRGRPRHVATEEKRRLVVQLCAFEYSLEQIAAALSITEPTLRKHYRRQLIEKAKARMRVEGKLLSALMTEVEAGNVAAIDKYYRRLDRLDMKAPPAAREEPLGKKAAANLAARTAHEGNKWQDLLTRPN